MSKKRTGLLVVLGTALGAAAGCIFYYLRYKSFNNELDRDFHDYEDGFDGKEEAEAETVSPEAAKRTYITIDPQKEKKTDEPEPAAPESAETVETSPAVKENTESASSGENAPTAAEVKPADPAAPTVEEDTDTAGGETP